MKLSLGVLIFLLSFLNAFSRLMPSRLFSDHMVLQRDQPVNIWGTADIGSNVIVSINGYRSAAKAGPNGKWNAVLPAMKEGGPYVLTIATAKDTVSCKDVMVGEVWLASGQSNMEVQLRGMMGYRYEQKHVNEAAVREFLVPRKVALKPQPALDGGQWTVATPATVGDFSAVAYYFAKQLSQRLHITVGIVNSSWGGTEAEDWISHEAMAASPELGRIASTLPTNEAGLSERAEKRLKAWAYKNGPVVNFTASELAAKPASFFDDWQAGTAPASWEWTGRLYSYRGQGFMQRTVKLDSVYSNEPSSVSLGVSAANMVVYLNGKKLDVPANNKLTLPAGTWKGGSNSLLINFTEQKSDKGFDAGLSGIPADLYIRFADTTITLADGNWHVMPDLSKPYHFDVRPNNSASTLYNSMIAPVVPYSIAGVIWYQGESNAERAYQYRTILPLLINDWRDRWHKQLPFMLVQLAAYGGLQNSNVGSNWAELREAQSLALKLPNTALAVTTDIGDPLNIHPRNKADVGYRLAASALRSVYKLPGIHVSPMFASAIFNNGKVLISFKDPEGGLMVNDKYGYVKGFEVAGADHKFYYAKAEIVGDKVRVWSSNVKHPVAVRYGWTDAPVEADLFSKYGFPVAPFRSDDWPGITTSNKFE